MVDDDLERILATLTAAIAEARTVAAEVGIGEEFRTITRHAREMHYILLEALLEREQSVAQTQRGRADALDAAVARLEELAKMPGGKMQWRRSPTSSSTRS